MGRLIWRLALPDSLRGRTVTSAKIVFSSLGWGNRPSGGQDLTVEGYRLLRDWNEGNGSGQQGTAASAMNNGATASGPSYGNSWNKPLVGLDGVDAETQASTRSTVAYLVLELGESIDSTTRPKLIIRYR